MSDETYTFRPAERADLMMLRRWLATPAVARWWGDPADEAAGIAADLDDARMVQLVISHDGRPFAYVQHYDIASWPAGHFAHLPAGTRAVDVLIGEPEMLGRGHGAAFLRRLALDLIAGGAPAVAIDPEPANAQARRAYARAGFAGDMVTETDDGPCVVMVFDPGRAA